MASAVLWVEPHRGVETNNFRTLITDLEALLPRLRAMSSRDDHDNVVIGLMARWLNDVNASFRYDAFADFAVQWCHNDDRPPVKKLAELLFFPHTRTPLLAFIRHAGCWTFRLTDGEKSTAARGYARAKEMVNTTIRHFQERGPYFDWLFAKYFGNLQLIAQLDEQFVQLKAAFDDNTAMDVICKGTENRAGERAVGYVDPAGDMQIRHEVLAQCSRCTYVTDRFFQGICAHQQNDELFSAQYHLNFGTTILHEMTHHVLKTEDGKLDGRDAYGRLKCILLAERSGARAMKNADNLALFAQDLTLYDLGFRLDNYL